MAQTETNDESELAPAPPEVKRYQRLKVVCGLLGTLLSLTFLAVLGLLCGIPAKNWLMSVVGDSIWLQLLVMAVVVGVGIELLTLPIAFFSGFVLEHRYQLSRQSFAAWLWRRTKGYLVGAVVGLPLICGLYALMWSTGRLWWLWAAVGYLAVTVVLGRLAPLLILPLFYKTTPLDDESLKSKLEQLAEGTGLKIEGVYRLHLSEETRKANAALTGLGTSRRVLLGDTLLDDFSDDEVAVVFAHEIGHHVHKHLPKSIIFSVLTVSLSLWLIDVVLGRVAPALGYDTFSDPAALPLVLFILSGFGLLLSPLQNAVSRHYERQCDRYALDRTGDPHAYRSAFVKLARLNKSDPDPNALVAFLFYDHPPIRQRLAMAEGNTETRG